MDFRNLAETYLYAYTCKDRAIAFYPSINNLCKGLVLYKCK